MRRGTNLPAVGSYNQAVILDLVRRTRAGLSRVEIAEATGLSPQTVTNVCRRLIDGGLIREAGKQITGPGKPRTILQLDPGGGYALGVHLDPSFLTYVIVDLESRVVAHLRTRTPSAQRPDDVIADMESAIGELLDSVEVPRERILGLGIAAPGPIDRERGIVDPPLLTGWNHVPLRDALLERLRMPVALEKDVIAAAVAELWTGEGTDRDDFAFFYYGTGLGVGLALDHEAVRGSTANAGDFGHTIVSDSGPLCLCGRRGCLGENTSPANLVRRAIEDGVLATPEGAAGRALDAVEVDECFTRLTGLAAAGDAGARRVTDAAADDIARGIVTLVNLLDLDNVVFGGPFWERLGAVAGDRIRAEVAGSAALVTPHPISISSSRIGEDVAAVGAACQVLDATFSPRPSALLIAAAPPARRLG